VAIAAAAVSLRARQAYLDSNGRFQTILRARAKVGFGASAPEAVGLHERPLQGRNRLDAMASSGGRARLA